MTKYTKTKKAKYSKAKKARSILSIEETADFIGITREELVMKSRKQEFIAPTIYIHSDCSLQFGYGIHHIKKWMAENKIAHH